MPPSFTHDARILCSRAYDLFRSNLAQIDRTECLVNAATAISIHAFNDVVPDDVEDRLDELASAVRRQLRSDRAEAKLAHLHNVLFDLGGYQGDCDNYFNPLNSYLPVVLATRRGIPITLCLLYKAVGERLGLRIEGVHAPGHFLARVYDDSGNPMLVDPFFAGQKLTRDEAFNRLDQVNQQSLPRDDRFLQTATHQQWIGRMIANLQHIFEAQQHEDDLAAMNELQALLSTSPV